MNVYQLRENQYFRDRMILLSALCQASLGRKEGRKEGRKKKKKEREREEGGGRKKKRKKESVDRQNIQSGTVRRM